MLGEPVDLKDLYDRADDREAHREAAVRTMASIAALGEADRAFIAAWRGEPARAV
jgi:hypothetical protein